MRQRFARWSAAQAACSLLLSVVRGMPAQCECSCTQLDPAPLPLTLLRLGTRRVRSGGAPVLVRQRYPQHQGQQGAAGQDACHEERCRQGVGVCTTDTSEALGGPTGLGPPGPRKAAAAAAQGCETHATPPGCCRHHLRCCLWVRERLQVLPRVPCGYSSSTQRLVGAARGAGRVQSHKQVRSLLATSQATWELPPLRRALAQRRRGRAHPPSSAQTINSHCHPPVYGCRQCAGQGPGLHSS